MREIIHINATPEFFENEKSVEMVEKLVELAYHIEPKKQICYKSDKPCPYDCQGLCKDSY